jgi:hypothetical protein
MANRMDVVVFFVRQENLLLPSLLKSIDNGWLSLASIIERPVKGKSLFWINFYPRRLFWTRLPEVLLDTFNGTKWNASQRMKKKVWKLTTAAYIHACTYVCRLDKARRSVCLQSNCQISAFQRVVLGVDVSFEECENKRNCRKILCARKYNFDLRQFRRIT